MSSSNLIRWGAATFALGGVVWVVLSLVILGDDLTGALGTLPLLLYIIALLLSAPGIVGFHALQKGSYGRLGRAGFYAILASGVVLILGTLFLLAGAESVDRILYPAGILGISVGFVLFGVATFKARVLPRWCGVLFILLVPAALALVEYGDAFAGLAQLALSYMLWSHRDAPFGHPTRVV